MPTMSTHLTVVAHIRAKPDAVDLVREELEKLVPITRAEAGCFRYDLHQDNDSPEHFMFFETWESRALWQAHMDAPHLSAFGSATEGAVEAVELFEMTQVR